MNTEYRLPIPAEMKSIYMMGFDAWNDGMSKEAYLNGCAASPKYSEGRWRVLNGESRLVSSLLLHDFGKWDEDLIVSGIGSIATDPSFRGRGFGHSIIKTAIEELEVAGTTCILLYSDIEPRIYERLGFAKILVEGEDPRLMVRLKHPLLIDRVLLFRNRLPDYF